MSEQPPFNMELAITAYRNARDLLHQMEEEEKARRKPIQARKDLIEGLILQHLRATNQKSARTNAGTATQTTKWTATLSDKTAFMAFVTKNQLFVLLDKKANAPAVKEYLEEHKALPPGCNLNSHDTVNVRRPTTGKDEPQEEPNE
jgi:hypothetical protein